MGTVALKVGADGSLRASKDMGFPLLSSALKLLLALSIVGTNILTLYSISVSRELDRNRLSAASDYGSNPVKLLEEVAAIRHAIRMAQQELLEIRSDLHSSLDNSRSAENVLEGMTSSMRLTEQSISTELQNSIGSHKLPLGRHPLFGTTELVSAIGHACASNLELLEFYMNYTVGELCPDDWHVAQRLMVRGCEPLPRRRCFARSPTEYAQPTAFPESLWTIPADESIRWTRYSCKSFECLNKRKFNKVFEDCIDCFELEGIEKRRWVTARDRHDFIIDQVLAMKNGTIRVGLDIGGGSGSFAARMAERNVTIITTTLNLNGPFSEFIALRGLLPLYLTIGERLPFFDNTLDIVHSMHVLSNWIPTETLEFILYDIDRILRPGGVLWLDRFFCTEEQLTSLYIPMIEKLGYSKLRWATGLKADKNGRENHHVYLSALLEKPVRAS